MALDKQSFLQELANGEKTFTFVKKDGSDRIIRCTRNPELIPGEFHPKSETQLLEEQDVIPAFDLDVGEWRSFTFSTIKE
jgi:hypothetical protein